MAIGAALCGCSTPTVGSQSATVLAKQRGLSVILILNQQAHFKVIKIN
jgi:hypothetical protein